MCKHKYTLTIRSDADYVCTSHDGAKVEKEFRNDRNDVFESYESTRSRSAMMTTTTAMKKKKKKKASRMRCEWIVISIYLFSFPFLRLRRLHRHRHRLLLWIQCFWIDHFVYAVRQPFLGISTPWPCALVLTQTQNSINSLSWVFFVSHRESTVMAVGCGTMLLVLRDHDHTRTHTGSDWRKMGIEWRSSVNFLFSFNFDPTSAVNTKQCVHSSSLYPTNSMNELCVEPVSISAAHERTRNSSIAGNRICRMPTQRRIQNK